MAQLANSLNDVLIPTSTSGSDGTTTQISLKNAGTGEDHLLFVLKPASGGKVGCESHAVDPNLFVVDASGFITNG